MTQAILESAAIWDGGFVGAFVSGGFIKYGGKWISWFSESVKVSLFGRGCNAFQKAEEKSDIILKSYVVFLKVQIWILQCSFYSEETAV